MKFLLTIILAASTICSLCGCVAVKYEHPDYGKLEYSRMWAQEIENVEIIIKGNPPIELRLNGQRAEMPEVDKIAGAIAAGLVH